MRLDRLVARGFRNLADVEWSVPPAGVALLGANGQGKTNLLEAIYYLEIFRSFRGGADEQLVRFGADTFHIRGHIDIDGQSTEVAAGYEQRSRRKRVAVDGTEPERMSDALGKLGVVVFSPSDVEIVNGAPGERRLRA